MFGLKNIFNKKISNEDIAKLLKTDREALKAFDNSYKKQALDNVSNNLFEVSAKQASNLRKDNNTVMENDDINIDFIIDTIVDELINKTKIWSYDGMEENTYLPSKQNNSSYPVITNKDISNIPNNLKPQLTGNLMSIDVKEPSYIALLDAYKQYLETTNKHKKMMYYHRFRQGLDILDLDNITYEIIGMNKNSIGYWLPELIKPVQDEGFFKIPKTTIIKVPMTLLQLTRKDYTSLTETTIKIVNKFCQKVFNLELDKDYFIKTGTYSSKFDFRNAHVVGEKEVQELGEYLLFIHYQALCMAHYDVYGRNQKSIYGVSTTNEWCVREYIKDKDNNPTIYNGLPLHAEYRVFVDFDTDNVLAIHPYWDASVLKKRFSEANYSNTPKMKHDYITFTSCEEKLNKEYNKNKDEITKHIQAFIKNVNLKGQWSIDVMQNGEDFWIIDLALAENSAYYEFVPKNLRKKSEENWLPKIQ